MLLQKVVLQKVVVLELLYTTNVLALRFYISKMIRSEYLFLSERLYLGIRIKCVPSECSTNYNIVFYYFIK